MIDRDILRLPRIVHYGLSEDINLAAVAEQCLIDECVMVFITPAKKELSQDIKDVMSLLGDRFWLYEMNMGMKVVLEARARDYVRNYRNSRIWIYNGKT